jgi:transmembrane sensor
MSLESTSAIDRAAGDWLALKDGGCWSAVDQAAFDAWLAQSPLHQVAYLRLEYAWEEALRLRALGAGLPADATPPAGQWRLSNTLDGLTPIASNSSPGATEGRPVHVKRPLHLRLAVAAAAAAILIGGLGVLWDTGLLSGTRFSTPVGGVESLSLSDGSRVTLNTDSQIRVEISGAERRVQLGHGESLF